MGMSELPVFELLISDDLDSDLEVNMVSFVDKPAIEKNFLAFNEHLCFAIESEEQRIVSGALILADTKIFRRDPDGGEYYVTFPKETIKKLVLKFFKKGFQTNVNIMHTQGAIMQGVTMFESWIIDKERGIMPMKGFENVTDGSWFGSFKVENDEVWEMIKSGEVKGFSVEGMFNYSVSKDEMLMQQVYEILNKVN